MGRITIVVLVISLALTALICLFYKGNTEEFINMYYKNMCIYKKEIEMTFWEKKHCEESYRNVPDN